MTTTERPEAPREARPEASRSNAARRLGTASWGVFFLWIGYALLAEIPLGIGLLGVGAIILATQAVRKMIDLPLEAFWVLVGLGFLLAATWDLYGVSTPLGPVLLLGLGALLVAAAFVRGRAKS